MTITALSGFEPFSVAHAKNTYHASHDTDEKARSAENLYRFYLSKGGVYYDQATKWFGRAFENNSPEAAFIAYTITDPQHANKPHDPYSITSLLQQKLQKISLVHNPEKRAYYLVHAAVKKHPIACQMSSYAIARSATEAENSPLLDALEDNGFDITYDQMLELHAIALIQGERILTNIYSQLISKNTPDDPHDRRRLGMLKTIGLEADTSLSWDFRVLSAFGKGRDACAICFKGLVDGNQETVDAFERSGVPADENILCSLGYNLRHHTKHGDYEEVLKHFKENELVEHMYTAEEMRYIYDHGITMLQRRIDPVKRKDFLAPDIFHRGIEF